MNRSEFQRRSATHLLVLGGLAAWAVAAILKLSSPGGIEHKLQQRLVVALLLDVAAIFAGCWFIARIARNDDAAKRRSAFNAPARILAVLLPLFFTAATWPGPRHIPLHIGNIDKFQLLSAGLALGWLALAFLPVQGPAPGNRAVKLVNTLSKVACALFFFAFLLEAAVILLDPIFARRMGNIQFADGAAGRPRTMPVPGSLGNTNSLGFNDTEWVRSKPQGVFRIAALGDSFAFGTVTYDENFLTLLEQQLSRRAGRPVEVLNLGQPGTSPKDYLSCLQRHGWGYEPDLVLINFFIGNDFDVKAPFRPVIVAGYPCEGVRKGNRFTDFLYKENWHVYQLFRMVAAARAGLEKTPVAAPPSAPTLSSAASRDYSQPTYTLEKYLDIQRDRSAIFLRKDNGAVLRERWGQTQSYLEQIHQDCLERTIPLVLAFLPDEFQVVEKPRERFLQISKRNQGDFDLTAPNRILAEYAAARKIPWIDLSDAFLQAAEKEALYIPRDTHWNPAGNKLAAESLAPVLLKFISPY